MFVNLLLMMTILRVEQVLFQVFLVFFFDGFRFRSQARHSGLIDFLLVSRSVCSLRLMVLLPSLPSFFLFLRSILLFNVLKLLFQLF